MTVYLVENAINSTDGRNGRNMVKLSKRITIWINQKQKHCYRRSKK